MSTRAARRLPVVEAVSAGGVVWRRTPAGDIEIVIGFVAKERRWALPKGTPERGESLEATALREVAEETGLQVALGAKIGAEEYWFTRKGRRYHKRVHHWLMTARGGAFAERDHEFDEVEWAPAGEALARITFATERSIVERALAALDDAEGEEAEAVSEEPRVVAATGRLRIREKRIEDAPAEYAWRRDPEVARYDATRPLILSYREFVQQFERDLRFANPSRHAYAIETAAGEHIGALMYYNADHASGAAEYGISIGPAESRGAGLGTEATIAFLRFAWGALPLRRIYLHTLEWNERARRSFERAGFRQTDVVLRSSERFLRMEAKREWWLLWDNEGRFDAYAGAARPRQSTPTPSER